MKNNQGKRLERLTFLTCFQFLQEGLEKNDYNGHSYSLTVFISKENILFRFSSITYFILYRLSLDSLIAYKGAT